jgi:hypothetical protein
MEDHAYSSEIQLGNDEVLRVSREHDHGRDLIELRVWYPCDGAMRPARQGAC